MNVFQQIEDRGIEVSRFEYEDRTEIVADFGTCGEENVDVVGGTAIIVVDDEQYELTVPSDAQVFMNNGILTVEVKE